MGFDRNNPKSIRSMPLILKILIAGIPMVFVLAYSFYSTKSDIKNKDSFYKLGFSSIVTKLNTSEGRVKEFHLSNGLRIYFWLSSTNTVSVGDSIQKAPNTFLYKVYKKQSGDKYRYSGTYITLKKCKDG